MPVELPLLSEGDREMVFAHRPLGGWVFCGIGASVFYAAFSGLISDATARWWFGGAGAFFAVIGLLGAFWRHELSLDLVTRTYRRRKGFWPHAAIRRGSLDDLDGVVLKTEIRRSSSAKGGSHHFPVWVLGLAFSGERKPVSIMEFRQETKAYQGLESLAKKLRITAIDRTEEQEKRTPWDALDRPLLDEIRKDSSRWKGAAGRVVPPMPYGSTIQLLGEPGRRTILLPRPGFSVGIPFLILFGFACVAIASFVFWAKTAGRPFRESHPGIASVLGLVYLVLGLLVLLAAIAAVQARMVIQEGPTSLAFGYRAFGRSFRLRRLPKGEIEEIRIKPVPTPASEYSIRLGPLSLRGPTRKPQAKPEVFVRSDREVVRLGQDLKPEEQEWLRDVLLCLLAGS
jgi:hypothetical protein